VHVGVIVLGIVQLQIVGHHMPLSCDNGRANIWVATLPRQPSL
jgi:hypothetical protein